MREPDRSRAGSAGTPRQGIGSRALPLAWLAFATAVLLSIVIATSG